MALQPDLPAADDQHYRVWGPDIDTSLKYAINKVTGEVAVFDELQEVKFKHNVHWTGKGNITVETD
eukprot:9559504-Prorocentrum_lima.AAC.1